MDRTIELTAGEVDQDMELVAQARGGSRAAFDLLFNRHKAYIYNVCYRMLLSEEDSRDATQSTFIRAYRSLHSFKGGAAFRTWLYRIAVNVCVDAARKRKQHRTEEIREDITPEAGSSKGFIQEALKQLHAEDRAVLVLFYIQGLSGEELGEALGCSAGTARVRLHRSRQALKRKYEELSQ